MTDRELLELAAKAAGFVPDGIFGKGLLVLDGERAQGFDPLNDDGDALRLAAKLQFDIAMEEDAKGFWCTVSKFDGPKLNEGISVSEMSPNDSCEATRRAIVRAAAEMGKAMP